MCVYGFGRLHNTHKKIEDAQLSSSTTCATSRLFCKEEERKRDARHTCVCVRQLLLFDYQEEEGELLDVRCHQSSDKQLRRNIRTLTLFFLLWQQKKNLKQKQIKLQQTEWRTVTKRRYVHTHTHFNLTKTTRREEEEEKEKMRR